MANEKRLGDINALCEFFQERYEYLRNASETPLPGGMVRVDAEIQGGAIIAKEFLDKAKNAPTVDAVEVVPCKDCRHLNVLNRNDIYAHCPKTNTVFLPFELDTRRHFCSLGERREGE